MKTFLNSLLFMAFLLPSTLLAQTTVTGTVTEQATALPLPGVNVILKGTSTGTTTDFDGNFSINLKSGDIIVFSYIGYKSEEITYTNQANINVSLSEDASKLEEIVLIGYGSVKKSDATGSVDVLSSDEFNKGPIVSADQLLTGKIAGVRITTNGGQPDAAPNIRIRGGSSISANNNPLIVIDGIPIDNVNPAGVSNPLNLINPNDIESFSILKDASATAIYGSRASNGVIIITTKKGTTGEVKFNFSTDVSVANVNGKIDLLEGDQFVNFIQQYHPDFTNLLGVPVGSVVTTETPTQIISTSDGDRAIYNSDWQDAIYRTAFSTNNNFSARANLFGKIPFRGSLGYTNAEGIVKSNDYERYSMSLKLSPTLLDDHLKIDINAKGLYSDKNTVDEGGALGGAVNFDPTKPIFDTSSDNRFGGYYQTTVVDGTRRLLDGANNPLALLQQRDRPETVHKLLSNIELDYKLHFFPELRAVLNLGVEASKAKIEETFDDNSIATYRFDNSNTDINTNFVFNPGVNYRENQHITNTTMDAYLVYNKNLSGFLNKFDIQAGYAYQNFKNDGNKELYEYDTETGLRKLTINPDNLNNRYYNVLNLQSFFGRTNLDFDGKYLVTLSFRADGSSLFRKDKRWGYFPAGALAWKVNEEEFLQNADFLNVFKLRVGVGKTGQQDITGAVGFYPSIPLFIAGSSSSQYLPGVSLYSASAFNPDLTWEKTTTYNVGLDYDFFRNSILSGSVDLYRRDTNDLLARTSVPPGQALSDAFIQNVGSTESKGFEASLNLKPITTDNVNLELFSNIAYNRTEVVGLKDVSRISASESGLPTGTGVRLAYHAVGYQPYSAWVFKQVYDADGSPILNGFADLNGDNIINNDDRFYKTLRPNWTYGFGLNFNYKNWDLSSSFRGQVGGLVYNAKRLTSGWVDRALPGNTNSLNNVLDFYSGAADFNIENVNGNVPFSDYFLEDASFMRCENIVVGCRIGNFLKDTSLRIYGAVNNPFIITDYNGQDPENFNSIDNNFYPRPTVYSVGINLDF